MIQIRFLAGILHSTRVSAQPIKAGRSVKIDSNDKWVPTGDDERGFGIALQEHLRISTGLNIFNASYDEGQASSYYGRRNPYKQGYDNVGQPLGVAIGAGNVIENLPSTAYTGSVTVGAFLTSGASGILKSTTDKTLAIARVELPGNAASGDSLGIVTL